MLFNYNFFKHSDEVLQYFVYSFTYILHHLNKNIQVNLSKNYQGFFFNEQFVKHVKLIMRRQDLIRQINSRILQQLCTFSNNLLY